MLGRMLAMRRLISPLAFPMMLAAAMLVAASLTLRAGDKENKMLRHMVLYKFKDDAKPAQVQEVIDAFAALPSKIDTIAGFEMGTNVSPEGKSEGLTHAFVVTFRDAAGRDAYLAHPAHLEYVKLVRDRREKVIVFDYWTGD